MLLTCQMRSALFIVDKMDLKETNQRVVLWEKPHIAKMDLAGLDLTP